jgi:hypothetical protein
MLYVRRALKYARHKQQILMAKVKPRNTHYRHRIVSMPETHEAGHGCTVCVKTAESRFVIAPTESV